MVLKMGLAPVFPKQGDQDEPCHKSADVGRIGDPTAYRIHSIESLAEKLQGDPKDQQYPCRQVNDSYEPPKGYQGKDAGMREQHQVGTEHTRNRTGGPDRGNYRSWIEREMGHCRHDPRQQIEKDKAEVPHAVLDIISENP